MDIADEVFELDDFIEEQHQKAKEELDARIVAADLASGAERCPIQILLAIYCNCPASLLYLNHMAGFRSLVAWLGTIRPAVGQQKPVPQVLMTYEVQEIAKILGTTREEVWWEIAKLKGII